MLSQWFKVKYWEYMYTLSQRLSTYVYRARVNKRLHCLDPILLIYDEIDKNPNRYRYTDCEIKEGINISSIIFKNPPKITAGYAKYRLEMNTGVELTDLNEINFNKVYDMWPDLDNED